MLFLLLCASDIVFANSQLSFKLDNGQNGNCSTENGITTCVTQNNAVVNAGTLGGTVESRRKDDGKELQRFKLVPNEGQSMLRGDLNINSERLKTEMNSKMLNEGGKY